MSGQLKVHIRQFAQEVRVHALDFNFASCSSDPSELGLGSFKADTTTAQRVPSVNMHGRVLDLRDSFLILLTIQSYANGGVLYSGSCEAHST